MSSISENLKRVTNRVAEASVRAGREASDVRLIAVSKTKPVAMIKEAVDAGQLIFGENYVQEAIEKVSLLAPTAPQIEWHLIGSIQSKKAKQVAGRFALIHSVDREKLVKEIARAAAASGDVQDILLQLHIGNEETKQGASIDEAPALIETILSESSLRLRGLMSLPPLTDDERVGRANFAKLRDSLTRWRSRYFSAEQAKHFVELSMGTSSDYEWAILEGATYVRVGTAIFGERET